MQSLNPNSRLITTRVFSVLFLSLCVQLEYFGADFHLHKEERAERRADQGGLEQTFRPLHLAQNDEGKQKEKSA